MNDPSAVEKVSSPTEPAADTASAANQAPATNQGSTANKALAAELFARFTRGDVPGVLDLLSDDATWTIPGKKDLLPAAGEHSKPRVAQVFYNMMGRLQGGLEMRVLGAIAEGDQVAMEVESSGDLQNGRQYRQQYHFLLTIRDGRIHRVKEYLDTQHVHAVWFAE